MNTQKRLEVIVKGIVKLALKFMTSAFQPRETIEDYYRIEYGIKPDRKKFEDYRFPHV